MASFQIPKRSYPGFEVLFRLDDGTVNAFIAALKQIKPAFNLRRLASEISEIVPAINPPDAESVLSVVLSIYVLRARHKRTISELVAEIIEAIQEDDDLPKPVDWQSKHFADHLKQILSPNTTLDVIAKASGVLTSHQHIYCNARVMSDIRPVFGSDVAETPTAAVIVHTLIIVYHEDDEHKEVSIALDTADVRKLQAILSRAETKTGALKKIIEASQLSYMDVEEQE